MSVDISECIHAIDQSILNGKEKLAGCCGKNAHRNKGGHGHTKLRTCYLTGITSANALVATKVEIQVYTDLLALNRLFQEAILFV